MAISLHINVSTEDIAKGEPSEPSCCPVALATMRAAKAAGYAIDGIDVDVDEVDLFCECGDRLKAKFSPQMEIFVCDFDCHLPVTPFEDTLTFERFEQ